MVFHHTANWVEKPDIGKVILREYCKVTIVGKLNIIPDKV